MSAQTNGRNIEPCTSRYLTADGRVLRCEGHAPIAPKGDPHGTASDHMWPENDPCAWDASCPDCDGGGATYLFINPDTRAGVKGSEAKCPRCGGTGTLIDVPEQIVRALWLAAHRIAGPTHTPEPKTASDQPTGAADE